MASAASSDLGDLTGLVLEANRGTPIDGATIAVLDCLGAPQLVFVSDTGGRFRAPGLPPASYLLIVSARGRVTAARGVTIEAGKTAAIRVRLAPAFGGALEVIVLSEEDVPLAGASVTAGAPLPLATGRTGRDGRCTLSGLATGVHVLTATKDDFGHAAVGATVIGGRLREVRLVLPSEAGTAAGLVREAITGEPIPGAVIRISTAAGQDLLALRIGTTGAFVTPSLSPGQYNIIGNADGFGHAAAGVAIESGGVARVDLPLLPFTGGLRGRAGRGSGELPVPGALVRVIDSLGLPVALAITDAQGLCHFPCLAEDVYQVAVSAPFSQATQCGAIVRADSVTGVDVALQSSPGFIEARVVDRDSGHPLPGAAVGIYTQDDVLADTLTTDLSGCGTSRGLAVGFYKVLASARGYASARTGVAVVAGATAPAEIGLGGSEGSVRGTATGEGGCGLPARVTVSTAKGLMVASCTADSQGRYALAGLSPGGYTLLAASPGHAPVLHELIVPAGQGIAVDLSLHPHSAALRGKILSKEGPVRGAVVRVLDEHGRRLGAALSDPVGDYVLPDLPPGRLIAVISGPGLAAVARGLTLDADRQALLDVEVETGPCSVLKIMTDIEGNPLADREIRILETDSGTSLFTVVTNAEGFFWLRGWSRSSPTLEPWTWY